MRIAIVGGGATGTLAAIHIAKHVSGQAVEILLVDPGEEIGRGLAYSTTDPRHLLNVRVSNMSAFPEEPQHLHDWLKAHGGSCPTPFHFISRGRYGDYLSDLAQEALDSAAVRHVRDVCVDIVEDPRAVTLRLGSGGAIEADHVILATGNDAKPAVNGFPAEQPWTPGSLEGLPQDASILVIGSGLTMVDMLLSLDRRGHRGPVVAVSRRGLLPSAHRLTAAHNFRSDEIPFGADLSKLLAWLRLRSAELTANGADWRSAVDALRPYTQRLWREMTLDQRRRFLRHARVYWEVHRHRMAPEIEQALGKLSRDGRLTVIAGRVIDVKQDADRL
ncbi:MAG TPA: FAD/NAD(P)-binding protein, partial [Roseiarcus sp.]|nr:FAD/NAD(P)-binding protein [Roseiarcus sp.]